MITKERKIEIVKEFGKDANDTGATSVQIALLTEDINALQMHFKTHPKDKHSNRGLMQKIGARKRYLKYLEKNNYEEYKSLIAKLGLRK